MNPGQTPERENLLHPTALVSSDYAHLHCLDQIFSLYLSYPLFLYFDPDHPESNTGYSTSHSFVSDYYLFLAGHQDSYLNPPIYDSLLYPRNHSSII